MWGEKTPKPVSLFTLLYYPQFITAINRCLYQTKILSCTVLFFGWV